MSYQLTGKIKSISEARQVSETFKIREFVVTIDGEGKYPQQIQLQATNDKCETLNVFTIGSDVTVSFNLRGREWTNPEGVVKVFNTLEAWRIDAGAVGGPAAADAVPNQVPAEQQPVNVAPTTGNNDDLPF